METSVQAMLISTEKRIKDFLLEVQPCFLLIDFKLN